MEKIILEVTESQFELLTKALNEYKEKCQFMSNSDSITDPIMKMMQKIAGPELQKYTTDKKRETEQINILIGKLYFDKVASEQASAHRDQASKQ